MTAPRWSWRRSLTALLRAAAPSPGAWGERVAARFLSRRGLRIIQRNFRVPSGEIDIVALDGETLVFVEVKTVLASGRGHGLDRIDPRKRRRLRRAAHAYLARSRLGIESWRVDAVTVEYSRTRLRRRVERIDWFQAHLPLD